jgi:superfamily II DNA/RNA helicase
MKTFLQLNLKKDILSVLNRLKFKEVFEVQEKVIPLVMQGKNVVFTSRTGSGKTLAYLLGFLGKINRKFGIQMIVLVPTRELCIQVGKEIQSICDPLDLSVGILYGGREISGDYKTTSKKNQIIVGTPGRLIQHINSKQIKVGDTRLIVFDESDQMFDDGFYDECVYVRKRISDSAQVVLASATITGKVTAFINTIIGPHEFLNVGLQIPKNIVQEKIFCGMLDKNFLLLKIFSDKKFKRIIIFSNTRQKCQGITKFLTDNKIRAKLISGDLSQDNRLNHLNLFKDGSISALVATDVASRGLHIEGVDLVVNYDVPTRPEFYIHRIGRTGRTDKKGHTIVFICPEDEERFRIIEHNFELDVKDIS